MLRSHTMLLAVVLGLTAAAPCNATLLHADAMASMTSGLPFATTYLPIGTEVTASVDFDLGTGTPSPFPAPTISSTSGTFTWNDGTDRTFNVSSGEVSVVGAGGLYGFGFPGTGPTIGGPIGFGGLFANKFEIWFDIGVNPFTTTDELSTLLLTSTVGRLRIWVTDGSTGDQSGELLDDVSGQVIPEPATAWMLCLGLVCLLTNRRRIPKSA